MTAMPKNSKRAPIGEKKSPAGNPRFSVIVVTFKRADELRLVLESLKRQQNAPSFEVVIIDNDLAGSGEATARPFLGRQGGWRYRVSMKNNVSMARNLGAELALGEWLAFLDDDCVPGSGWLDRADTIIRKFPGTGLVFGGGYTDDFLAKNSPTSDGPIHLPKDLYLVEGNLFFQRSEYLALGGMRRDLGPSEVRFGYHEGSELQERHRIKFASGHRRLLDPGLAVRHLKANRMHPAAMAFFGGMDAVYAFAKNEAGQNLRNGTYHILKLPAPLIRLVPIYLFAPKQERRNRAHREFYRLGEICGAITASFNRLSRQTTSWLRFQNNRLVGRGERSPAKKLPLLARIDYGKKLELGRPFAAGKIGTAEILALEYHDRHFRPPWIAQGWRRPASRLANNAGFFPLEWHSFKDWDRAMRQAVGHLDYVCAWQDDPFLGVYEEEVLCQIAPRSRRIPMRFLGKSILPQIAPYRWLVISPFVQTMRRQLAQMRRVHDPENKWKVDWEKMASGCRFVRCPLQWHLEPSPFRSWEEGLEHLTQLALAEDFDVALIGAGAWSLPLAARIKKAGRAAIHTGGETQLFFGIKGRRWNHENFYNPSWVSVLPEETPAGRNKVDDGCYW
jgi:glycosyltransferase involved in cell wall biosynthesis